MTALKTTIASVIAIGGLACAASAQGWTGAYVGGAFGKSSGDNVGGLVAQSIAGPVLIPLGSDFDGSNGQLFGGYNAQFGSLVVGGELATFLGDVAVSPPNNVLNNLTDIKLRFGTTFGSALVYALAGYSFGNGTSGGVGYDFDGVNYGIGIDYAIGSTFFVGGEILARNIDDGSGLYLDARPMTTASIRAGFRF